MTSAQPPASGSAESDLSDRTLVDHLNVGVFMATLDERVQYANPALLRMLGLTTREELLTLQGAQAAKSEDRERFLDTLTRDGEVSGFESTLVRNDGTALAVSLSAVLLRDPAGRPTRMLGTIEDISERKHAEEQLELTQHTIDSAPDCAYWFDPAGRFIYANEAGCRALGYSREELLQLRVGDVNPLATPARWVEVWQRLKQTRTGITLESVHRRRDGSTFPVRLSSAYFKFGDREYCTGYAVDLTERRQAEAERASLQNQLLQAQKMESIGRLAGGVAHDFNNMLCVILSHAELALRRTGLPPGLEADLHEIRSAAQRSADLTRQLLAFARRQTTVPRVLDLSATIEGMLNMLRRLIGEGIGLTWRPGQALGRVLIDPSQVSQVLANLCVNARDAIGDVGTISIETANAAFDGTSGPADAAPGEYVRLSVSDTGRGMEPAVLEHLFEPFFTTKPPGEGTGLGLSTVYGIVKQNGGFIDVRSRPGAGTTFNLYLPRHRGDAAEDSPAAAAPRSGRETLLLVEDEPAILRVTARLLGELGYQVLAAATPDEALRHARTHGGEIHLLLVDVVMPEMNGRDVADLIAELRPHIKRLYMSGYPAGIIERRGVLHGGFHFLQKPFSALELAAKVREAIGE